MGSGGQIFVGENGKCFESPEMARKFIRTRLPGAVPQPLFLLLIVFDCIIYLRSSSIFKEIEVVFLKTN